MPKVVALEGLGAWISFVAFGIGVDDVAHSSDVDNFAGTSERYVIIFWLPEGLGEPELGLVVHVLFGKQQNRVLVDRTM